MSMHYAEIFSYWLSCDAPWHPARVRTEQSESCSVVSDSLWPHGQQSPWNSPGQNTGVGSGILQVRILEWVAVPFSRRSSNPGIGHRFPALQVGYLPPEPAGKPKNKEWVAYPFCRGSFWPRNRTGVFCITGRFFTNWATSEAQSPKRVFIL